MSELKQRAFDLYKPPFKFIRGYIQDSDSRIVADDDGVSEGIAARVRGWGRIKYLPDPEALQDIVGEMIAEALTEYWSRRAPSAERPVDQLSLDGAGGVTRRRDAEQQQQEPVAANLLSMLLKENQSPNYDELWIDLDMCARLISEFLAGYTHQQPQVQTATHNNSTINDLGSEEPAQAAAQSVEVQPLAQGEPVKIAPVQGFIPGIPWSLHLEAYAAYCNKYGPQKALIDLEGRNCRGGFHIDELDDFIPGWRDRVSEITALRKVNAELRAQLAELPRAAVPDEYEILAIFKRAGLDIELGRTFSVRGQIAQLLEGARSIAAAPAQPGDAQGGEG